MDAIKYTLKIDENSISPISLEALISSIRSLNQVSYADVWLISSDGPALSILKNGDRVFLMYLKEPSDPGYSTRSTDSVEDEDIEFYLANGQLDQYPQSWTVSFEEGIKAIEHFWRTQQMLDSIQWHDDSVD